MIGYEEDGFNAVVSSCKPTGPLDEALVQASKAVDPAIALREDCTSRLRDDSDHAQFLVEGLPAIAVSDSAVFDGYPCYHKPCDTAEQGERRLPAIHDPAGRHRQCLARRRRAGAGGELVP
jgi:hypothetical protein